MEYSAVDDEEEWDKFALPALLANPNGFAA
jgi:hypothetical protein